MKIDFYLRFNGSYICPVPNIGTAFKLSVIDIDPHHLHSHIILACITISRLMDNIVTAIDLAKIQ